MRRFLLLPALVVIVWAAGAEPLLAQGNVSLPDGWSGPGFYLSWPKILACWLVFLAWAASSDWISRDCVALKLDHLRWNPIVVGTFMAAFLLVLLIPMFAVSFPLLLVSM